MQELLAQITGVPSAISCVHDRSGEDPHKMRDMNGLRISRNNLGIEKILYARIYGYSWDFRVTYSLVDHRLPPFYSESTFEALVQLFVWVDMT